MQDKIPVGIEMPYVRGTEGYFKQTYSDIKRIHNNLKMLLMTSKGERPMMPTYGSDLRFLLFNPGDEQYDGLFEDAVIESVEKWMPEISILNVDVDRDDIDYPNRAVLVISFSINSIPDTRETLTLEVIQ